MDIPGIGRVVTIWDEVFCKIRFYFNGLVTRNEVLLEYIHRIKANLDMVVEVLDIQISISFEFCLGDDLIQFWWVDLIFDGAHASNFGRVSSSGPYHCGPYNRRDTTLEGGHSTKIASMCTIKNEINSPKLYEIITKTELKGDTDMDIKNFYNHIKICLNAVNILQ